MKEINNQQPVFQNSETMWLVHDRLQKYIETQQSENLPSLRDIHCFIVQGKGFQDLVLIDSNQNVLFDCPNDYNGYSQMEARINITKISKNF